MGLHGEKCGIGTIMTAKLHGLEWEKVRSALMDVHAPTTSSQIGITDQQVVDALLNGPSIRPDRFTILSQKKLTKESAMKLARSTGVV
jgi:glycerol-1-phosphate dehydrogenase [NAD(P)+]